MKIINISDIHGDFETFDEALEVVRNSDAEVLAVNGDLTGSVFDEKEKKKFLEVSGIFHNILPQIFKATNGNVRTFHDAAEFLTSNKVKANDKAKSGAEDYLDFEKKAKKRMLSQYKEFKDRFDELEQKVILVPGNWDGKCIDDYLAHENIHNKYYEEVDGVKFVGYGGSSKHPIELPQDLIIDFDIDEAFQYLSKFEDAEVALTHACPGGFEGKNLGSPGEYFLLAYLYKNAPSLILYGDSHNPFVFKEKKTGTVVANPGNLGRYKDENFGTFLGIEIDDDFFVEPNTLYKLNGKEIEQYPLSEKVKVAQ